MNSGACPVATVHAPVERVWGLLADPSRYDSWWEAHTVSIVPEGPARAGQQIVAYVGALGLKRVVHLTVQSVEPEKHQLYLRTQLPLGISTHNRIACTPLDEEQTRVSFNCDFSISPRWWAWFWEHLGSRQLHGSVAHALARLKRAAERLDR